MQFPSYSIYQLLDISHCICALIKGHRSTAILMLNCHYSPDTELPRVQGLTFLRNRLRTNKCNILSSSPLYSWLYVQRLTLRTLLSHTILCSPIPSHGNSSTSTTCLDHSQSSPSEIHHNHSLSLARSLIAATRGHLIKCISLSFTVTLYFVDVENPPLQVTVTQLSSRAFHDRPTTGKLYYERVIHVNEWHWTW